MFRPGPRNLTSSWCTSAAAICGILLLSTHPLPAPVEVLPEKKKEAPKPTAKPTARPKPKPKPTPRKTSTAPAVAAEPASDVSRRFDGTWKGTRAGSGTIVGRERPYPYQVSSGLTVEVTSQGRSAVVKLGSGKIRWSAGGPEGQAESDFAAKPHPPFAVREQGGSLVGSFHTVDGNWVGDRTVTLTLDRTGQTLKVTLRHTGKNRSSGISDSSITEGYLQRSGR